MARHDGDGRERHGAAAMAVQVASDPFGVDVEFDRADDACVEQRVGDRADGAERAGSITPPRVAPQQLTQSSVDAAVPWSISSGRFCRTEATVRPGAGTSWCQLPMSVVPSV